MDSFSWHFDIVEWQEIQLLIHKVSFLLEWNTRHFGGRHSHQQIGTQDQKKHFRRVKIFWYLERIFCAFYRSVKSENDGGGNDAIRAPNQLGVDWKVLKCGKLYSTFLWVKLLETLSMILLYCLVQCYLVCLG